MAISWPRLAPRYARPAAALALMLAAIDGAAAQALAPAPEKIGIPECDQVVDIATRCIAPLVPAGPDRDAIDKFYRDLVQSYKAMAGDPELRATAVTVCSLLLATQRAQLEGSSCKFD